jgi:hypothetical protein
MLGLYINVKSKAAEYNAALRYVKYTTVAPSPTVLKSIKFTKAAKYNAASRIQDTSNTLRLCQIKSRGFKIQGLGTRVRVSVRVSVMEGCNLFNVTTGTQLKI